MKYNLLLLYCIALGNILYAQPVINSFIPNSGGIGSTVVITGSNFDPVPANNTVYFGAVKAIVSFATTTSLTVVAPLGTTYAPVTVTVNGLTAYSDEPFIVTFPGAGLTFTASSFNTHEDFLILFAFGPIAITNFDFDNDGKIDLGMTSTPDDSPKFINLSTAGNLSFYNLTDHHAGLGPSGIDHGDIDGDGKQDIVFANYQEHNVWVLRNRSTPGNPAFEPELIYDVNVFGKTLLIRDMDADGKPDLVTVGDGKFTVLRNTSSPQNIFFAPFATFLYSYNAVSMFIQDFDGDLKPDLAVATNTHLNAFGIFRNTSTQGSISFDNPVYFVTGLQEAIDIVGGDLDADGKADIIVTNQITNTISAFRNTSTPGNLSFDAPVNINTQPAPRDAAIGDLDGDGKPELAITCFDQNIESIVSVFKNISTPGSIILDAGVDYFTATPFGRELKFADMDGDGRLDILTGHPTGNKFSILRNKIGCTNAIINLQPSDKTTCAGNNVVFSVSVVNATGYRWQVDTGSGWVNITNNSVYSGVTTAALTITAATYMMNNYKYRCVIGESCGSVYSSVAVLTVNNISTTSVSITADHIGVCGSMPVTFTAVPVNGGISPSFQWKKNNINVGSNSNVYIDNAPAVGDIILCEITSNAVTPCLVDPTAASNAITLVNGDVTGPVYLGSDKEACIGQNITISAGPGYISYLWQDGSAADNFIATATGKYYVVARDLCGNISSDTIMVTFNSVPKAFLPKDTGICTYSNIQLKPLQNFDHYLWNNNAITSSITVSDPGLYWLEVKDANGCTGKDSINITNKECPRGFYAPNAFTPNNDGKNDVFRFSFYGTVNLYEVQIFNRYGETVFQSSDPTKAWDGNYKAKKQGAGTYVWKCIYQIDKQMVNTETGTFLLLR